MPVMLMQPCRHVPLFYCSIISLSGLVNRDSEQIRVHQLHVRILYLRLQVYWGGGSNLNLVHSTLCLNQGILRSLPQGSKGEVMLTPPLGPEGGDYKPLKLLLVSNRWRSGQVCGRGRCVGMAGTCK